jgi:hypothetical protein
MSRVRGRATYVYAIVRAARRPAGEGRTPRGLPGTGPVRLLEAGRDLWLVVADAPLDRYGADAVERGLRDWGWLSACALAHERVVEHFLARGDVIPTKLFTLFASDERALAHVGRVRARLRTVLARVGGRREWGLRLVLDARRGLGHVTGVADRGPAPRTGTAFLAARQRQRRALDRLVAGARADAERVFRTLARQADATRRRPVVATAGRAVVLDAAFLVSARRTGSFRSAVRRLTAGLARRGIEATLTGPWPPYHFVGGR